jgi:putative flippase GtrA
MTRWLKFNAIGLLGVLVQLTILQLLVKFGLHYLAATALAVEAAVLHNYAWHIHFTWKDRPGAGSLWRFHVANGAISLLGNLALMKAFAGRLGWPVAPANLLAISITSVLNYFAGDRWVFHRRAVRAASTVE